MSTHLPCGFARELDELLHGLGAGCVPALTEEARSISDPQARAAALAAVRAIKAAATAALRTVLSAAA